MTCLPQVLISLWSYVEAWVLWTYEDHQVWSLSFMSLMCSACAVFLHTRHSLWVACTGDVMAWISRPHQGRSLGFANPLEDRPGDCPTWVLGVMLLHTCHSPWVACTRNVMVCSCMCHLWGDIYWRLSVVLLHTCHSLWVACTGDIVAWSCIHVTRCGWHVLES